MTMILGAVDNFAGVTVARFFLGGFEAGLFPGLIYCLTFWYKQDERALRVSLVSAVATLGKSMSVHDTCIADTQQVNRWSVRWCNSLRHRTYERSSRPTRLEMAIYS